MDAEIRSVARASSVRHDDGWGDWGGPASVSERTMADRVVARVLADFQSSASRAGLLGGVDFAVEDVRAFCDEHGRFPSDRGSDKRERDLANFVKNGRKAGRFTDAELAELVELQGRFKKARLASSPSAKPAQRSEDFQKVLSFCEAHGRPPRKAAVDKDEK